MLSAKNFFPAVVTYIPMLCHSKYMGYLKIAMLKAFSHAEVEVSNM